MSAASVQCPHCFTRATAAADGEVVCPGCERPFTPAAAVPPARKNPDVPYARTLPVGGGKPAPKPAAPRPARRVADADEDDRPRTRTRSRRKSDDEPVKRGGSALPLALIAGGVLAVLTLGGVVAVAAAMFLRPAAPTAPVAVAGPSWTTQRADVIDAEPDPFGMRRQDDPIRPEPRFPEQPKGPEVPGGLAPRPGEKLDPNSNALVTRHQAKLKATASSQWASWPVTHLLDGKDTTSWYSNSPDSTFTDALPWVLVTFPEDVSVKRVTVLGNRDPEYPSGYTVTDGRVELLDANGKVVGTHTVSGVGDKYDFDLRLAKPTTVRAIRFTMTKSMNGSCGLGEIQVE